MSHKNKPTPPPIMVSRSVLTTGAVFLILLTHLILPMSVRAQDTVMLSPDSGPVGTDVLLTGKVADGSFVSIHWDDQTLDLKVPIKADGELNYRFKVPHSVRGKHTITIRQFSTSSNRELASVTFTVTPQVKIFPDIGTAYTPLTITGTGFAAFEKNIKIIWDDKILLSSTNANQFGSWGVTCEAPDKTKGEHFISVSGSITTAQEVGTLKFIVAPVAKVEPLSGPVGTEVKIRGFGFRTGEDGITITYVNEIIECNIVGGADGSWDSTITIPPSTAGYHIIGVYGSSFTPKGIVPDTQFKVTPKVELHPDSGNKGDRITVKGTGFASKETVSVEFDLTLLDTVTTDDLGCFQFVFQVPESHKGEHIITASGSSGNTAKAGFVVEWTAPLPPKLLYPKDQERLEIFDSVGKLLSSSGAFLLHILTLGRKSPNEDRVTPGVELCWSGTTENEDITYTLQIDRGWDGDPIIPILTKEQLTETNFKCNLPQGRYTWQVKATDKFGFESPWSEPGRFQMVVFSPVVLAVLIVGPLLVAGLVIWIWFSIHKT